MTLTEGVLLLIVIILTILVFANRSQGKKRLNFKEWECTDKETGTKTNVKMALVDSNVAKYNNPEAVTHKEQAEFFSACKETAGAVQEMMSNGDCSGDLSYAVNEFGGPGLDYKDWVTSQAVSDDVIKNHNEFVKDRAQTSTNGNVTGRTYSPDSHDSYDPIPWQGIRGRPQAVAVYNPTQVPDVDQSLYSNKPTLTWNSSN